MAKTMTMNFILNAAMQGNLGKQLTQTSGTMRQLASQTADLRKQMKLLNESRAAGRIGQEAYQGQYERLYNDLQKCTSAQERLNSATRKFASARAKASEAWGNVGSAVRDVAIMAAPIALATREAIKFESAMADVRKVVDFDTPQQFKEMNGDILALTRTLPMAAEDIAKIVAAGGQSGIAREDLLSFADAAAKMGVAFDVTAEQAGDMMAKWRTAFKMNQADVVSLADKINYLGNTTAAAAPLISDVVTRIGPLGDVGGVASGEIAALGASMVGVGIPSEVAATGIKNLILSMVAGEGATKSQQAAFASLGLSATDMAKRMQVDAKGAIMDTMRAIQSLSKEEQAATLQGLFGKESLSAIAPLLSNLDNLSANFDKVADSAQYAGSMQAEFEARSQTTENQLILLKNAMTEMGIQVGSAVLPVLNDLAKTLAAGASQFAGWAQAHPVLLQLGMGLAALAGTGLIAVRTFIALTQTYEAMKAGIAVIKAMTVAQELSTAATNMSTLASIRLAAAEKAGAAAQWLLNAAMSANPAGLVVVAIMALVAAAAYMVSEFESVQAFMAAVWESPAAAVLAFVTGPIGLLIYTASGIISNWDTVKSWFTLLWDDPTAALNQFVEFFTGKLQALWETAQEYWGKIKDVLGSGPSAGGPASMAPARTNATGGIYPRGAFMTKFAEDSAEAAIPLDGTDHAIQLWRKAGEMLGVEPSVPTLGGFTTSGGNSTSNAYSISIPVTINGNADQGTVANIQSVVESAVRRALENIENHQRRVSFA